MTFSVIIRIVVSCQAVYQCTQYLSEKLIFAVISIVLYSHMHSILLLQLIVLYVTDELSLRWQAIFISFYIFRACSQPENCPTF